MNIAIITAGSGPEREISIQSGKYISTKIDFAKTKTFHYPEEYNLFLKNSKNFDCVIPLIHGAGGEDGELVNLLEEKGMNYIFSEADVHQVCFHKAGCKNNILKLGYQVPITYTSDHKEIIFPVIVKPQESGSSDNIFYIENQEQLDALNTVDKFIIEQFISGREFTVGVIDYVDKSIALPVIEINKSGVIFNTEEKYSDISNTLEKFLADDGLLENELKRIALDIHKKLKIKNFSRSDFIVTQEGTVYFIEINTIPGCTKNSLIPKMVMKANLDISDVIRCWIEKELT